MLFVYPNDDFAFTGSTLLRNRQVPVFVLAANHGAALAARLARDPSKSIRLMSESGASMVPLPREWGGQPTVWSSMGPSLDLKLKPDISAPGAMIYSAGPEDRYLNLQGTSMVGGGGGGALRSVVAALQVLHTMRCIVNVKLQMPLCRCCSSNTVLQTLRCVCCICCSAPLLHCGSCTAAAELQWVAGTPLDAAGSSLSTAVPPHTIVSALLFKPRQLLCCVWFCALQLPAVYSLFFTLCIVLVQASPYLAGVVAMWKQRQQQLNVTKPEGGWIAAATRVLKNTARPIRYQNTTLMWPPVKTGAGLVRVREGERRAAPSGLFAAVLADVRVPAMHLQHTCLQYLLV